MDKNLRDRVEKIAFDCLEEEIAEMEWLKDGCHKIATALCSLIEEREIEVRIDELERHCIKGEIPYFRIEELKSQLKDQKGEKCGNQRRRTHLQPPSNNKV